MDLDNVMVLVMELLEGEDLNERALGERLKTEDAIELMMQVADGLTILHGAGVIHRDIKPSNIFLMSRSGEPIDSKIVDLGIAKNPGASHDTTVGTFLGTFQYASPQAFIGRPPSASNDVYALGLSIWFALAGGETPYSQCTDEEDYAALHKTPLPSIRQLDLQLPAPFAILIDRCLKYEPELRPTASEIRDSLRRYTLGVEAPAPEPVKPVLRLTPPTVSARPSASILTSPSLNLASTPLLVPPTAERSSPVPPAPKQAMKPANRPVGRTKNQNQGVLKALAVLCLLLGGAVIFLLARPVPQATAVSKETEAKAGASLFTPARVLKSDELERRLPAVAAATPATTSDAGLQAVPAVGASVVAVTPVVPVDKADSPAEDAPAPKAKVGKAKPHRARPWTRRRASPVSTYIPPGSGGAVAAAAPKAKAPVDDSIFYETGGRVDSRPRYGIGLTPGMRFQAKLTVGVSTAKQNPVVATVSKAVKKGGRTILPKGTVIRGHASDDGRRIHLKFNRIGGGKTKVVQFSGYATKGGNPGVPAKKVEVAEDERASSAVGRGAVRTAAAVAAGLGAGVAGDLAGNVGREAAGEAQHDLKANRKYYLHVRAGQTFQIIVTEGGQ